MRMLEGNIQINFSAFWGGWSAILREVGLKKREGVMRMESDGDSGGGCTDRKQLKEVEVG